MSAFAGHQEIGFWCQLCCPRAALDSGYMTGRLGWGLGWCCMWHSRDLFRCTMSEYMRRGKCVCRLSLQWDRFLVTPSKWCSYRRYFYFHCPVVVAGSAADRSGYGPLVHRFLLGVTNSRLPFLRVTISFRWPPLMTNSKCLIDPSRFSFMA